MFTRKRLVRKECFTVIRETERDIEVLFNLFGFSSPQCCCGEFH